MREAPAPGADLDHVDHRHLQRQTRALLKAPDPAGFEVVLVMRGTILDQAHLGRGAAHVEGNDTIEIGKPRQEGGRHCASRRPRLDQTYGVFLGFTYRRDPAAREHDIELPDEAELSEVHFKLVEIPLHQRLHIGVGASRARPLVFANFRSHFRRKRQRQRRVQASHDLPGSSLVFGRAI